MLTVNWNYLFQFVYLGNVKRAASELAVSPQTIRRWNKTGNPSLLALRATQWKYGDLGAIHHNWSGWEINKDHLISPYGDKFERNHLASFKWRKNRKSEIEKRINLVNRDITKILLK